MFGRVRDWSIMDTDPKWFWEGMYVRIIDQTTLRGRIGVVWYVYPTIRHCILIGTLPNPNSTHMVPFEILEECTQEEYEIQACLDVLERNYDDDSSSH